MTDVSSEKSSSHASNLAAELIVRSSSRRATGSICDQSATSSDCGTNVRFGAPGAFATIVDSFTVCRADEKKSRITSKVSMRHDASQPAVELQNVGVLRGGRWILRDVNWSVAAGHCAAILGPNGSGKSTLARVISGYLWPTAGEVTVGGRRFGETDLNDLRHSIRLVQSAG